MAVKSALAPVFEMAKICGWLAWILILLWANPVRGDSMILEQIQVGSMANFAYVGGVPETKDGFVVDPGHEPEKLLKVAQRLGLNINRIFLTHHHYDHVDAAMALKARTGAKIHAHEACEGLLRGNVTIDKPLLDQEVLTLATDGKILVIHTPGHSPGGVCFVVDNRWLITGDTLFIGNCGRTDLPGSDLRKMFDSLQKIKQLPDSLIIFSGHDYGPVPTRTLGEEKKLNPCLKAGSCAELEAIP